MRQFRSRHSTLAFQVEDDDQTILDATFLPNLRLIFNPDRELIAISTHNAGYTPTVIPKGSWVTVSDEGAWNVLTDRQFRERYEEWK